MKKITMFTFIVAATMFATGSFFFQELPEQLPSHWNMAGEVDGYTPKELMVYGFPLATILLGALLIYLPATDPLKKNVKKFRKEYDLFVSFFALFIALIYGTTLAWGLGHEFPMNYIVLPAIAALMYISGQLMEKSKRNWFIGFKTPWTLSSDRVWKKTHALSSKMFKGFAFAFLFLVFYPQATLLVTFVLIGGIGAITLYSYLLFRGERA